MKTMMKLMALVMAMLLVVGCFAACTQDNGNGTTTEPSSTAPTDPTKPTDPSDPGDTNPPDDGKKEYKVYVKSEDGTAVSGVMVPPALHLPLPMTPAALFGDWMKPVITTALFPRWVTTCLRSISAMASRSP